MFCHNCGNQIANHSKFCTKCGASIEARKNVEEPDKTRSSKARKTFNFPIISFGLTIFIFFGCAIFFINGNLASDTNNIATTTRTFYIQSDNTRVHDCSSLSCKVTEYYSANTPITLPYQSIADLPEWVQVSWQDQDTGQNGVGFIKSSTLGENQVSTSTVAQNTGNNNVSQPQTPNSTPDLPSIVAEWTPRVVRIVCSDNSYISSGSGVLTRMDFSSIGKPNAPTVITNKHVVTDETSGYLYSACDFQTSDTNAIYDLHMSEERQQTDQDVAYFPNLASASNLPAGANSPMKVCGEADPATGDQIAILGFPADGGTGSASTAITLTQGVISSYDGEYYVTDAKIDHGNSGGAAILVKDDCYLGIPTWAESGGFESFGRILNASTVLEAN
jgi:hypothetical protein